MNCKLLKSKILLSNTSIDVIAKHLNITEQAVYSKIRGAREFKLAEIDVLKKVLNLTNDEIYKIFIKQD